MKKRMRHVALLIETSREYARTLLRGVIRYQREHEPWSLYFQPKGLRELPPKWLHNWHGDGILVRVDNRQMANAVAARGVPAVDLRFALPDLDLPYVGIDNHAVVELAVNHLLERGFRNLAFCGLPPHQNAGMDYRGQRFLELAERAGVPYSVFPEPGCPGPWGNWEQEQEALAAWVARLPHAVGVVAVNDDRGIQVLEACRETGVRVPDAAAVVGADNDEFLCNLSTPPMSSVDLGAERVGYEAAALLDRLMAGREVAPKRIILPPVGVVVRQSSDVMAIPDRELAESIRFIREHACEGIRVEDVLGRSRLSASTLQRRFKAVLGRTPKEEITRLQMETAKRLLVHTDLPNADIAARCGFAEPKRFITAFHEKVGASPGTFRRHSRPSRPPGGRQPEVSPLPRDDEKQEHKS
jgi:LacI family transcriptional regulator